MESEVVLYKSTGMQAEKQFVIEDIDVYLFLNFGSDRTLISKYQYIKHGLNITLKLNLSQTFLNPSSVSDYDYLSIKNGSEKIHYYFITGKRWLSTETIEFQLVMDTLNTFKWNVDYIINKKTLVMREHKDRIVDNEIDDDVYERKIDLRSEGIQAPLYKIKEEKILQNDRNISWILYYRSHNPYDASNPDAFTLDNPVDCFIAPSFSINARYSSTDTTVLASSFSSEGYYYIDGNSYSYLFDSVGIETSSAYDICIRKKSNGKIDVYQCNIVEKFQQPDTWYDEYERILIASDLDDFDVLDPTSSTLLFHYRATYTNEPSTAMSGTSFPIAISPTTIDFVLDPENIKRSDTRNIKIIELPYAPTTITYDDVNDVYLFDSSWEYDGVQKLFKLKSMNMKFQSTFRCLSSQFWDNLLVDGINDATSNDLRNDNLESKIFHSDYYYPKFVYDSFTIPFELQKIDFSKWFSESTSLGTTRLVIDFVASRNVISKFMFKFPQYITKYGTADFDNICVVSRNNEQVIYNSTYLNYIRNGYNYDLKSKQRMEEAGSTGLTISTMSTILGVVGSFASGNYGMGVLAGVGGALTIANQMVNYAKNVAQTEQNIQQKLQESKMQAVNVLNADDIDLLNAYCDNKAKICHYEVSPAMKQAMLNMFYYAGYSTNEQKIPSIDTRFWFNYLQCDLVIDETNNLPESIIQDIKNRFKDGCTFFHNQKSDPDNISTSRWNIAQTLENYESWILS